MFKRKKDEIIEIDEGFSVKPLGWAGLVYSQGNATLFVDSELLVGPISMVVYANRIKAWDSGKLVDEQSKKTIVENIRKAFAWEGSKIDVEW